MNNDNIKSIKAESLDAKEGAEGYQTPKENKVVTLLNPEEIKMWGYDGYSSIIS